MQRRIALAIATAAALAATAGSAAFAANAGLLGSDDSDRVGELSAANVADLVPTSMPPSTATPEIVVIDEFITVPGGAASAPSDRAAAPAAPQGIAAPGPSSNVASLDDTESTPPTSPVTMPAPDPNASPGPGWEWDEDDQKWEFDNDDDYDDDDYDDDHHQHEDHDDDDREHHEVDDDD